MSNYLKFCSCRQCISVLRTKYGSYIIRYTIRKNRRKTKEALKKGEEPMNVVSVRHLG